jgi:hypothetical protein
MTAFVSVIGSIESYRMFVVYDVGSYNPMKYLGHALMD